MRLLFAVLFALYPIAAKAGLFDLLPLAQIERKMLYPLSPTYVAPASLGLRNAEEHILTIDDETLVVWHLPAHKTRKATVLYFHGNAGNLANRAERFRLMQSQGIAVVAMSYRGSSGSSGIPSEPTITQDAIVVFQAIAKITKTSPQDLILYGESLGSAVAIALLAHLGEAERPAGVILEAPFTSTPDMARSMADIPGALIERISDRWDSLSRVEALTLPTLILHGTNDEVTPIEMGRTLFAATPVKDKDFIAVQGASHSGTWRSDTMPKLWRFIHSYGG